MPSARTDIRSPPAAHAGGNLLNSAARGAPSRRTPTGATASLPIGVGRPGGGFFPSQGFTAGVSAGRVRVNVFRAALPPAQLHFACAGVCVDMQAGSTCLKHWMHGTRERSGLRGAGRICPQLPADCKCLCSPFSIHFLIYRSAMRPDASPLAIKIHARVRKRTKEFVGRCRLDHPPSPSPPSPQCASLPLPSVRESGVAFPLCECR